MNTHGLPTTGLPFWTRLLRRYGVYLGKLSAYRPRVGDRVWYYATTGEDAAAAYLGGRPYKWTQTKVLSTDRFERAVELFGLGWVKIDTNRFIFIENGRRSPVTLQLHIDEQEDAAQRLLMLRHDRDAYCQHRDARGNCKGHALAYVEREGVAWVFQPGVPVAVLSLPIDLLSAICSMHKRGVTEYVPAVSDAEQTTGFAGEDGII